MNKGPHNEFSEEENIPSSNTSPIALGCSEALENNPLDEVLDQSKDYLNTSMESSLFPFNSCTSLEELSQVHYPAMLYLQLLKARYQRANTYLMPSIEHDEERDEADEHPSERERGKKRKRIF
ncbi:MAG: hypothetical protein BGO43_07880 [Gammaproteobacteria bacterium 39-13]|nr:hypothetical protein [Gammaproteobacteria bacterium]OJV93087.1 MAG: hypothetical protein BGO43_07880 [Gammaproteobacteria bacterium 39-13]